MTYDREAAAVQAKLEQDRIKRRSDLILLLIAFAAGVVVGIGFFQKSTYERARNNTEDAARALCSRGFEVVEPGIGSLC